MAKKRNASVQAVVNQANSFFVNSDNDKRNERKAIQSFVTTLLLSADCYCGFNYLHREHVPSGHTWGINFDTENSNHSYPDDSRINFY